MREEVKSVAHGEGKKGHIGGENEIYLTFNYKG